MKRKADHIGRMVSDEHGLTLVELMIVMVLSMVLMAAVYATYEVQKTTSDVQHEVSSIQQDLRAVLDIMARDIRQAGCDPTLQSTAGIVVGESGLKTLTITMDLNEDGDISDLDPDERVSYALSGKSLQRNGAELAYNVTTLGFIYRDANAAVITPAGTFLASSEADGIRYIDIVVHIQSRKKDPDLNEHIQRTMTKRVKLRNLGL